MQFLSIPTFSIMALAGFSLVSNLSAALDTSVSASQSGPAVTGFLLGNPSVKARYDFDSISTADNGLSRDGWVDLMGRSFPSIQVFNNGSFGGGRGTGGAANGTGNQDSSHPSAVIASPPFELVENMAITFGIGGGTGTANLPADLAAVPAASTTTGFQGVGLRRLSDNTYVLHSRRGSNNVAFETKVWDIATLAAIRTANPGVKFSIDWIDYYHGSWGFGAIDDVVFAVGGTPVAPFAPVVLTLSNPTNLAGAPGFGGTLAGTLSDAFAYNPMNPTATLPDQIFNGADGYHNNNTNTDATIRYDVTPTVVTAGTAIVVDLWSRADCCQNRDDNVDVAFLDASDVVLGEVLNSAIPDAAPQFIRVSTSGVVADGVTVAKIRVTGHNSEGPTDTTNSFTLMEIRAAKVAPLITTVNGLANNGSPITLASGATVTVNPNGEFVYDPAGGTFSPPTTDTFSVVSGYGGVVTDTGTVTVNISGPGSTVYVDDLFAGLTIGDPITDADLGTTGDQDAIFGTDAFASIGAAVVAAAPGATIVVNSGTYSERVALTDEKILRVTGVDVAGTVSIIGIGVSGGGMIVIDGASGLVAGDCALAEGSVVLNGTSTFTLDSASIEAAVTGSGSLVKNTASELVMSGAKGYTGGTIVNGGRVRFLNGGTLGSGDVMVNSGGQVYMTTNMTNNFTIEGNGWTEAAGVLGAIRFQGTTLTGNITVAASGARIVGYSGATGAINGALLGNGNLEVNFDSNTNANGTISLLGSGAAHTGTVTVARGRFNMGAALGGSVVVASAGTLGDEGAISGDLQIGSTGGTGGTIVVDPVTPGALSANNLSIQGVATASMAGVIPGGAPVALVTYSGTLTDVNGGTLTDSFTIAGGGALRSPVITDNAKTLELSGAAENSVWTANTSETWQSGLADSNWTSADGMFFTGDSVTFDDTVNASFSGIVTAVGNPAPAAMLFNNTAEDYQVTGGIAGGGSLTKQGTGVLILASQNSYTGGTFVNAGLVDLTGGGGINGTIRGAVTVENGAILRFSSGDVTGYGNSPASLQTINLNGGQIDVNTVSNQTLGGAMINMTGGSLTGIAGSNLDFFQGPSKINVLASADPSTISGTKIQLRQNGGLVITVADGAAENDLVINSVVSIAAGFTNNNLTKAGDGVMLLNGANTVNTQTNVNAGTLGGTGSLNSAVVVASGATLAPGASAVGTFTVNNAATFASGAMLEIELDGSTADKLAVSGVLDVTDATIDFSVLNAPTAAFYQIATAANVLGTPNATNVPSGYSVIIRATGIKLATPYGDWASENGLLADVNDATGSDPDSDTLANLLEFAFGTNPGVGDNNSLVITDGSTFTAGTPIVQFAAPFTPTNLKAQFVRRKDAGAVGLTYTPEFSADMSTWETDVSNPVPAVVSTQAGDYEVVEVPYVVFLSNGKKASFFRVRVTLAD